MSGTLAYFDCFSGASGDMILGALVDCGLPIEALGEDLRALAGDAIRLRAETVLRSGIRAVRVNVDVPEEHHAHRGLSAIRGMIRDARLSESVKERAIAIFTRLGEVEAEIHGVPVEEIHFHEVGALDSIADIVGAAAGLERLGAGAVLFSTLRLGGGTVQAGHGALPVPAPATARLVTGFRCEMGPVERELLTPTAAAILTTLGRQQSPPPMRIAKIGYGAGGRDNPGHPNVLRLFLGEEAAPAEADAVWVLEANLDDVSAEVCGYAIERLLAAGALDAYAVPIQMKKSRPAWMLCAIVGDEALLRVEDIFFRETTTFGVRCHRVERTKLSREVRTVETPHGPVRVKAGMRQGNIVTASPEYEDCRRIAMERNIPLREVMEAARKAFEGERRTPGGEPGEK